MRFLRPFRIATYLSLLFCAGHTLGGMVSQKSLGPESDAVFAQMKAVHFVFNGADSTWYGFWMGFGLTVSAFLLLVAFTAWTLDAVPAPAWRAIRPIAWALVVAMAFNGAIAAKYFFIGPVIFSVLIVAMLLLGIRSARRAESSAAPSFPAPGHSPAAPAP